MRLLHHRRTTDTSCKKGQVLVKDTLDCKQILCECRPAYYENEYWNFMLAVSATKVGLCVLNDCLNYTMPFFLISVNLLTAATL